jgi:F-type H+-transporting ATPase subunit epsilon
MIRLEIVTPERKVVEADVDSVTVPTTVGEAGILPSHAPLVSAIKPGVLTYSVKGSSEKVAISSGFLEVSNDKVAVLVDSAEAADEINVDTAKIARDDAEKALSAASQNALDVNEQLRETLEHANARLAVIGR